MKQKSVLAVDDDELILQLVGVVVESSGGTFIGASNARECLDKLENIEPNLIILDVKMEGLDGLELLGHIRDQFPGLRSRVLFLTAQKTLSVIEQAEELGCDGFILKPIDPYRLRARIQEAFQPTVLPD